MSKLLSTAVTVALIGMSAIVSGCSQPQQPDVAYKAKVTGSGCPFGGCVTSVKIISGPYAMKTCRLEYVKIETGDTVLVSLGDPETVGYDPTVCRLR